MFAEARYARHLALGVALCLAISLQQVVIGHALGVDLSLGSMALRALALGASAYAFWRQGVPRSLRGVAAALGACLLVLALSAGLSEHRDIAVRSALRYALELLLLWAMLNLCVLWRGFAVLLAEVFLVLLWLGLALAVAVMLQVPLARELSLAFHPPETFKYLPRVSGFYEHPALLAANAVVLLGVALQLRREGLWGRWRCAAALLACVLALLLSGARNPLFGVAWLGALWLWERRRQAHVVPLAALVLAGGAALFGVMLAGRLAEISSARQEGFFTAFSLGRTYLWHGAFDAWCSRPWLGLGPGVFQYLVPDFTGGRFDRGELHAHNLLLGVLSETGALGLLALLALAAALWRPWLSRQPSAGRRWAGCACGLLLALGLCDFYLPFYGFALYANLLPCLAYSLYLRAPDGAAASAAR